MKMSLRTLGLAVLCLAGQAAGMVHAATTAQVTSPVRVTGGLIAGNSDQGVAAYLGIPFAAPPEGKLRWRAPHAVPPWKGIRQTSQFAPACAQTAVWITLPKSEDCLYLNVWAPEKAARLPVIVWLHGGGYYGGSAAQPLYDGVNLARHGAVVVTINYRLGIFGFFSHPELTAESPRRASGNQGIQDQIAALRWVQTNIAAFGGDPQRVTIMGESAGGESVGLLMASPPAKGLFQRAISQSGHGGMPITAAESSQFDLKTAEAAGVAFARAVGAANLAQLRALGVDTLHKAAWSPRSMVDGYVLREDLTTLYQHRRQHDVPLLLGWNADEGKDLAPEILANSEFTAARHVEMMTGLLGHAPSEALLARYPGATDGQATESIYQLTNDWWGWRMAYWAGLQARHGKARPFMYFFAHQGAAGKPLRLWLRRRAWRRNPLCV